MTEAKSLLPYNREYVLIHKRSLVVNTATNHHLIENLATVYQSSFDEVAEIIGGGIVDHFHNIPDEEVYQMADKLVEDCLKSDKQKITITSDVENE